MFDDLPFAIKRAAAVLKFRRRRAEALPAGLFNEYAWDIMLDMFANQLDGNRATITIISARCDMPASIAVRWARYLVRCGLIEIAEPVAEGSIPRLTHDGIARMCSVLTSGSLP